MSRPELLWSLAPSQMLCCLVQIKFSEVCNKIGVRVPKMWSITSHDELRKLNVSSDVTSGGARFLLKCVSYDPKHRTDLFTLPATSAALEAYLKVRRSFSSLVLWDTLKASLSQQTSCGAHAVQPGSHFLHWHISRATHSCHNFIVQQVPPVGACTRLDSSPSPPEWLEQMPCVLHDANALRLPTSPGRNPSCKRPSLHLLLRSGLNHACPCILQQCLPGAVCSQALPVWTGCRA